MKEVRSQEGWKAGMPVSIPYLPFPLEPADGSLVLGKLEKSLSMSKLIVCSSTEQQAIAQVQLMNGTFIQIIARKGWWAPWLLYFSEPVSIFINVIVFERLS